MYVCIHPVVPGVAEWPPQREGQHHQEDGEEARGEPCVHERDGRPVTELEARVRARVRLSMEVRFRVRAGWVT